METVSYSKEEKIQLLRANGYVIRGGRASTSQYKEDSALKAGRKYNIDTAFESTVKNILLMMNPGGEGGEEEEEQGFYTAGAGIDITGPVISLSHLGLEDLPVPGEDKILFYDYSAGAVAWSELAEATFQLKVSSNDSTPGYLENKLSLSYGENLSEIIELFTFREGANEVQILQLDETKISHDSIADVSVDDHHSEVHTLATTGPHTGSLPLIDLAPGTAGDIITRQAADWAVLAKGTENYVLKMGATYPVWGQTDWSELTGTPTTFAGYGISDTLANLNTALSDAILYKWEADQGAVNIHGDNVVYGSTASTACVGNDARLSDARTPTAHALVSASHTASGLTAGHFLKALTTTTFGFAAHGLSYGDVGAAAASHVHSWADITSGTQPAPVSHAASHLSTGADTISLFATASVVSGLVPGSNSVGATYYLNATGNWTVPPGSDIINIGTTTQIPYVNVAGDDFLYSANLVFTATGLGINTANPDYKLDIEGAGTVQRIKSTSAASEAYSRWEQANGDYLHIGVSTDANAVSFINSEQNPLWFLAEGYQYWKLGAAELMRLTTTGLGIGTDAPSQALDVIGSIELSGNIYQTGTPAQLDINPYTKIRLGRSTNNAAFAVEINKGNNTVTVNHSFVGNGNSYVCGDNGKFGIGTTSPVRKFTTIGGTEVVSYFEAASSGYAALSFSGNGGTDKGVITTYNGYVYIGRMNDTETGAENDILINSSGYVSVTNRLGVNQVLPTCELDVNGAFHANAINVNGAYDMPTTAGTDQYFLQTNGTDTASWVAVAASQIYKGTWNADTNTPTLANGTGTAGWYYRCTVAGTTDFGAGNITFAVGDDAYYNGSIWEKIPGTGYDLQAATSVVLGGVKIGTGLQMTGTPAEVLEVAYGSDASTACVGNDSRVNNGQTAFGWGDWSGEGFVDAAGAVSAVATADDYLKNITDTFTGVLTVTDTLVSTKSVAIGPSFSGNNLLLAAEQNIYFNIDSDNNFEENHFYFLSNTNTNGGGNTLFFISDLKTYCSNKLGIGITDPGTRLEVDGVITATEGTSTNWNTAYAASHAQSHTIASHSDTIATGANLNTLVGGGETALHSHAGIGGTGYWSCWGNLLTITPYKNEVHLLHGTVVTRACVIGNPDTEDKTWTLYRVHQLTHAEQSMATANIGQEDTTISYATIDNSLYYYYLAVSSVGIGEEVWAARITYTL